MDRFRETAIIEPLQRAVRPLMSLVAATVVTVVCAVSFAEDKPVEPVKTKIVPVGEVKAKKDDDVTGWNHSLGVNGTFNFVSNRQVVGQLQGESLLLGLGVTGASDYVNGKSLWRNQLSIAESFARTPAIKDRFVKTNDVFEAGSDYNYFFKPALGVFARAKLRTSLFSTYLYSLDPGIPALKAASPLKPLALEESIGGFTQPVKRKQLNVRIRAGLGGRHTLADGVLLAKDDAATPEVEFVTLSDVHQAGGEVFVGLDGKVRKGRLTYNAGITLFLPFVNNDASNRAAIDLMRVAMGAEAKLALFDWMSVVYKFDLNSDPQLFTAGEEVTQIQNSVLLTFQFTLIERKKAKKKPDETELLKKAKEEAENAAKTEKERADKLQKEIDELKEAAKDQSAPGATPDGTNPDATPGGETDPNATGDTDADAKPDAGADPNGTPTPQL